MTPARRILCIEDNAMNWRLVQRLLSQAGYEVHWAEDGMAGYDLAVALSPDLILLDINLPGLSGFEVATKLRKHPACAACLIVALTARTMRSDRETALVTGCDGFISKPIDPFQFVGQVEAYLSGRRDHLEQGREGAALRQFSQQVVERLEIQLRQAQEANLKLLEAQSALEARNRLLSRLLDLSRDLIPVRDTAEMIRRSLQQLGEDLSLDCLSIYSLHPSGGYFQGQRWSGGTCQEASVLPRDHVLLRRLAESPGGRPISGESLIQSALWEPAAAAGLWDARTHGLLLPLQGHSPAPGVAVFLAAGRKEPPFQAFELELTALYAELLNVSLENADLIRNLDETSRALGASYERMETAYLDLQAAQKALGVQDRKAALGDLFLGMAHRLQDPVKALQSEVTALEGFMALPAVPPPEERGDCHRSLSQIHQAIGEVEGLVNALLRRAGQGGPDLPEWVPLHALLRQELDLMRVEGGLPAHISLTLNLQAEQDRAFGVYQDFADILGHLVQHGLAGATTRLTLRTWGGGGTCCLEVEDDGGPLVPEALANAFEPFLGLRSAPDTAGRKPGAGLPACAQVASAYRGTLTLENTAGGTRSRLCLPLE
jgi:DNA-binding response OmpR family regulator/signal transduction histidine kinase